MSAWQGNPFLFGGGLSSNSSSSCSFAIFSGFPWLQIFAPFAHQDLPHPLTSPLLLEEESVHFQSQPSSQRPSFVVGRSSLTYFGVELKRRRKYSKISEGYLCHLHHDHSHISRRSSLKKIYKRSQENLIDTINQCKQINL